MKIFSIYNHKGGCGKTSLCHSISVELVIKEKKVLMIDTDTQGNLSNQFCKKINYELADYLYNDTSLENTIHKTDYDNLFIIPSKTLSNSGRLQDWQNTEMNKAENRNVFTYFLQDLQALNFDFVFFDMPPSYTDFDKNILLLSDEIIPVLQVAKTSIDGLNDFFPLLAQLRQRQRGQVKPILNKLIFNQFDARKNVQKAILPTIKKLEEKMNVYYMPNEEAFRKAELQRIALQEKTIKENVQETLTKITNDILGE